MQCCALCSFAGDAHLSIAQLVPLAGAVLVSTPQEVALQDARRAADMFAKLRIPLLGVVQNMSAYVCAHCGHREPLFGIDGASRLAAQLHTDVRYSLTRDRRHICVHQYYLYLYNTYCFFRTYSC